MTEPLDATVLHVETKPPEDNKYLATLFLKLSDHEFNAPLARGEWEMLRDACNVVLRELGGGE